MKIAAIIVGLGVVLLAWLARFDVQPAPTADHHGAYVLDRWTGELYVVQGGTRVRVADDRR